MSLLTKLKREPKRIETCVERFCRSHLRHGSCVVCGAWTDYSGIYIEESTLRRRKMFMCTRCEWGAEAFKARQEELREIRTRRDWERVTDPVENGVLKVSMPEQYASKARTAVRAFAESGFEFAAVKTSDAASLNQSILTLGLQSEMYVEVRDGETILRRAVNV